jgi:hypothetical protein
MAILNKTGITDGSTIQSEHVTRTIDALTGVSTDTIVATGSFSGNIAGTASFATTASYALNASAAGEYITLNFMHKEQSGTTAGNTTYFGTYPSSTSAINRIGFIAPFACTIVSSSITVHCSTVGTGNINYDVVWNDGGVYNSKSLGNIVLTNNITGSLGIGVGVTVNPGRAINIQMVENSNDGTVVYNSSAMVLLKKI